MKASFGAFLKTVKESTKSEVGESSSERSQTASRSTGKDGSPLELLMVLADKKAAVPAPDLMKASRMPYNEFAEALDLLVRNGLAEVKDATEGELIEITPLGAKMTSLT